MASSTIQSIAYGISPKPATATIDPVVATAERALWSLILSGIPGSFWVDYMPLLKFIPPWFPCAGFRRKAKEWRKDVTDMLNERYDLLKRKMADEDYVPACFVTHCSNDDSGYDEQLIRESAGAVYMAGTDTTLCAWETFFLAMLCNPDVQTKAQEEIDRVIGASRLPEFNDRDHLPYVMAIVYEVLRLVLLLF
ncbi:hypothetical protein PQX77_005132 [Marasmius sp. AFHP31]|nr:hypothetical protein PQX77_005132 [Marasmius sp. AFHP31]